MRRLRPAAMVALAALLGACGAPRPAPPVGPYPGSLVPSAEIPGAFLLRQQVVAHYPGHAMSFEALLQKQGDVFTVVALTPFGTRAFVLQQRGTATEFTSYVPAALPFPPGYMLLDIHRVLFLGLGAGAGAGHPADGEQVGRRDGEEIRERWAGGRLMERHFRRLAGDPPGTIDVRYVGGMEGTAPPRTIEYRNGWFGYALTITTLTRQAL